MIHDTVLYVLYTIHRRVHYAFYTIPGTVLYELYTINGTILNAFYTIHVTLGIVIDTFLHTFKLSLGIVYHCPIYVPS